MLHTDGCVCVFVRPFTVKASFAWISWTARGQINNVMLHISYAKSLHHYFKMKYLTFLNGYFI